MKPSELIPTPDKWCKYTQAQRADGSPAMHDSPKACRWCLTGAIYKAVADQRSRTRLWGIVFKALETRPEWWNDVPVRKHPEVLKVLQTAEAEFEKLYPGVEL